MRHKFQSLQQLIIQIAQYLKCLSGRNLIPITIKVDIAGNQEADEIATLKKVFRKFKILSGKIFKIYTGKILS